MRLQYFWGNNVTATKNVFEIILFGVANKQCQSYLKFNCWTDLHIFERIFNVFVSSWLYTIERFVFDRDFTLYAITFSYCLLSIGLRISLILKYYAFLKLQGGSFTLARSTRSLIIPDSALYILRHCLAKLKVFFLSNAGAWTKSQSGYA